LKTKLKRDSKEFATGYEWQHNDSKEVVWIMLTTNWDILYKSDLFVVDYVTQDGIRKRMDCVMFLEQFTPIPTMKGAYH
jgi:hypothetical protein